jgi:hypothetical protein
MAGNPRICNAGKGSKLGDGVAVTHAAGLHADAHMPRTGLGKFTLNNLKGSARGGYLYCTSRYRRHGKFFSCALDDG